MIDRLDRLLGGHLDRYLDRHLNRYMNRHISRRLNRRSIYIVIVLSILVGVFFQVHRMDAFLHISPVRNMALDTQATDSRPLGVPDAPRDKYLIIYDPNDVGAMLTRHFAEKVLTDQKKDYVSQPVADSIDLDGTYTGVVLIAADPEAAPGFSAVLEYARAGGTVAILEHPNPDAISDELKDAMGIVECGPAVPVNGLMVQDSFVIGAAGFHLDAGKEYNTDTMDVTLGDGTTTHITSDSGMPVLWENGYGDGRVIVYNGVARDDKNNLGLYTAMLANCGSDGIYPVMGTKLFYIDDFPSPAPEGSFPRLYDELHVDTAEFYRSIWWPYMQANAEKYNLKYTGLIIETYGDQVKGPFKPLAGRAARDNVIVYGHELLAMGGELGIHGYNHMSLAPAGYNQENLHYTPWEGEADMTEAMEELHRYVKEFYPDYEFRTYVPPSNVLSPEGYRAVKRAFPELKVYASLWDGLAADRAYYQDFGKNTDNDTYNLPRVSAGYNPDSIAKWANICAINYIGVFSHFVHPDEIFYEESEGSSWSRMEKGLVEFLDDILGRYPWLQAVTASEAMEHLDDYLNLDYRVVRDLAGDKMTIYSWGTRENPRFILRSEHEVDSTEGCTVTWIDNGAYLVETTDTTATIHWKKSE